MKVLYINKVDRERAIKVRTCCVMSGIQIVKVEEEAVAALPEEAELMKLIDMDGTQVHAFLASLRRFGVRVDLKCVETEHNRDWSLERLYAELKAEHEYMQQLAQQRKQ